MPKKNRHGQAAILTPGQYAKLRQCLGTRYHRLLFDIARYTGERLGAVIKLQVSDCYNGDRTPRNTITFRWATRKQSAGKRASTREVHVSGPLYESLENFSYYAPDYGYLFPGRFEGTHISFDNADDVLRRAIEKARFQHLGISTHSFRRSAATAIGRKYDVKTLQEAMGWRDARTALRYIDCDEERVREAINSI